MSIDPPNLRMEQTGGIAAPPPSPSHPPSPERSEVEARVTVLAEERIEDAANHFCCAFPTCSCSVKWGLISCVNCESCCSIL